MGTPGSSQVILMDPTSYFCLFILIPNLVFPTTYGINCVCISRSLTQSYMFLACLVINCIHLQFQVVLKNLGYQMIAINYIRCDLANVFRNTACPWIHLCTWVTCFASLFLPGAGDALQIQCYQCEEMKQNDCSTPEYVVNCTVNVQDMCQKEVLIKPDGKEMICCAVGLCFSVVFFA